MRWNNTGKYSYFFDGFHTELHGVWPGVHCFYNISSITPSFDSAQDDFRRKAFSPQPDSLQPTA
ncbi:MAG: hypothetical protein WCO63_03085 [Bacteroidota bacterium]